MYCLEFLVYFLLLVSCTNIVAEPVDVNSIQDDIAKFNITCYKDNCDRYDLDSLSSRACHCGIQCVQLGTCCIDSNYVDMSQPELKPACRSVSNGYNYFVVDKCSSDTAWASLCHAEWNGENDVKKFLPVTSLLTSITYKNYYCLRCHETTDQFLYWILKIENEHVTSPDDFEKLDRSIALTFFQDTEGWMAIYDEDIGYISVNVTVKPPYKIKNLAHVCEPNVISDCSEKWSDEEVRSKCQSYTSLKEVKRNDSLPLMYKNIHCALCNFEALNDIECKKIKASPYDGKTPFSFTFLLDINQSDGELVGKIQKCSDDHIWDPYSEKCRKFTCALPGYKVQNGKCVKH